jgi:two-component system sensor histidine kinase BaeS
VRDSLLWRLLGAQLFVIAIAVAISGVLITNLASHSFMQIMLRYHIDPAMVEKEFHAAARGVLVGSSLIAAVAAMLLGWVLVRRLVRPLAEMMMLAERIAEGDYAQRVVTRGPDEMARLADSLNRMAAALQRIEALRRDLVANVAHELRTPLSTLQGYLEALRDGITPPTRETLESLHEEVLRLVRLVHALHQLSQFDARVSRLRRDPVDLGALVHMVVTQYAPESTRRGMAVREVRDPRLPPVDADTDLVSQALRNLLDNALRYAPEGATITVETALQGGAVRVTVRDTGEGIAPEDLVHIFERFYRGEKSRSRETGGAGIGLALVQEIARAHGGDVGAASSPGATTVWFSLPVRIGDTRTVTSPSASSPSERHEGWGRHRA